VFGGLFAVVVVAFALLGGVFAWCSMLVCVTFNVGMSGVWVVDASFARMDISNEGGA